MTEEARALIERLYRCFNERDEACLAELCDERMEFFPVGTAEALGREAPYSGRAGLHEYLADIAQVWEELRVSPGEVEAAGGTILVRGRAYARSRELGIRDLPVAWIWEVEAGRLVRGEVFLDPERGLARFASAAS